MKVSPIALALVFLAIVVALIYWQRKSVAIQKVKNFFSAIADKVEFAVNKLGFQLIAEWRKFYSMYSIWFYAALGTAPDLYNLAVSTGMLDGASAPVILTRIINTIAFVGAASRLIQQKQLTLAREKAEAGTKEESDSSRL